MLVLSLVSAVLLAGQASASAIQARSVMERAIFARQGAGGFNPASIPQPCQATCAGTSAVLTGQGCQTNACLCTSTVNTGFQQCLSCVLSLAPPDASLTAQSQDALVQFEQACAAAGLPLASLTVSGATAAPTNPVSPPVSLPSNTGSPSSPSVFFSPPGSSPSASGSSPANTPPASPPSSPTRSVIGPSDTSAPSQPADNNNGAASSGEKVFVTMSGVLGAGVVGAMMVIGF